LKRRKKQWQLVSITFFCSGLASRKGTVVAIAFFSVFEKKKKTMAACFHHLLL